MNTKLDFLSRSKRKTLRTMIHEDIHFSPFEIEILHTPIFQRLYDLKQLGFSDRVFPDAIHSRFNHVLGVTHRVEQMVIQTRKWLKKNPKSNFEYDDWDNKGSITTEVSSSSDVSEYLKERTEALRLIGLVHDLTHAAYGHTLEDEIHLFEVKHDSPIRQKLFFDALCAQLVWIWSDDLGFGEPLDPDELENLNRLKIPQDNLAERVEFVAGRLEISLEQSEDSSKLISHKEKLCKHLKNLELAFVALLHLDLLHDNKRNREEEISIASLPLLVTEIIKKMDPEHTGVDFKLCRDALLIDIIGNTICADLLDYAQRDAKFAGLKTSFDDRIMRYLCVVSVKDRELTLTDQSHIRLGIQFYSNKMRLDVLSEMSTILKVRYQISESILLHPTKCAAGAMLGSAIQLLGLKRLPQWLWTLGDVELMMTLKETAKNLTTACEELKKSASGGSSTKKKTNETGEQEDYTSDHLQKFILDLWPHDADARQLVDACLEGILLGGKDETVTYANFRSRLNEVQERAHAVRIILWHLSSRRFPQPVYRLRTGVTISSEENSATLANKYAQPDERYKLERTIERKCALPLGSIFVHCPKFDTQVKVAKALVVGTDPELVRHLGKVVELGVSAELMPYQAEVESIEKMYKSIWKFHIYLDHAQRHKAELVELTANEILKYSNDPLLKAEMDRDFDKGNPYDLLSQGRYVGDIAINERPLVIERLDAMFSRFRGGFDSQRSYDSKEAEQLIEEAIKEVRRQGLDSTLEGADKVPDPKSNKVARPIQNSSESREVIQLALTSEDSDDPIGMSSEKTREVETDFDAD